MESLDDELLFIVRLMKRQTNAQKRRVLNSLSGQLNYIVTDNQVFFLTKPHHSEEITCQFTLELDEIFGTLPTNSFLFIFCYDGTIYFLNMENQNLYTHRLTGGHTAAKRITWRDKTRIGTFWLKWLNRIKNLVLQQVQRTRFRL